MNTDDRGDNKFIQHQPCDACGSSDASALYSDNSTWCFSCSTYTAGDGEVVDAPAKPSALAHLLQGEYQELRSRKLTEQTCRKFGYMIGEHRGKLVQIATYRDLQGRAVAQKVRTRDKQFSVVGDSDRMGLFGMHLWSAGKKIVICEGELDAMSVSQVQNHKYATVSVPHGAQSAKKHLLQHIDYLNNFAEIVLMFDQDEAGQAAAQACAEVLPIGKTKIAVLPLKDANECLVAGNAAAIISAIHQAADFRPDGIVSMGDLREVVAVADAESPVQYPYPRLNEMLKGIRTGVVTLCAGSGVGKSTLIREMAYHIHMSGFTVGMLMLEESVKRSAQGLAGIHIEKNITVDAEAATADEIKAGFDSLMAKGPIYLFDHFGSTELDVICNRIRYMKHGLKCDVVFLDHISILISGGAGDVGSNERVMVDHIMHTLRVLCSELDLALVLVSHLRRPGGDLGHEGGAKVSLSQLRGSHALAQLADACVAMEVDADEPTSGRRNLVVLKNRHTGEVGPADQLQYNRESGRLRTVYDDVPF